MLHLPDHVLLVPRQHRRHVRGGRARRLLGDLQHVDGLLELPLALEGPGQVDVGLDQARVQLEGGPAVGDSAVVVAPAEARLGPVGEGQRVAVPLQDRAGVQLFGPAVLALEKK